MLCGGLGFLGYHLLQYGICLGGFYALQPVQLSIFGHLLFAISRFPSDLTIPIRCRWIRLLRIGHAPVPEPFAALLSASLLHEVHLYQVWQHPASPNSHLALPRSMWEWVGWIGFETGSLAQLDQA